MPTITFRGPILYSSLYTVSPSPILTTLSFTCKTQFLGSNKSLWKWNTVPTITFRVYSSLYTVSPSPILTTLSFTCKTQFLGSNKSLWKCNTVPTITFRGPILYSSLYTVSPSPILTTLSFTCKTQFLGSKPPTPLCPCLSRQTPSYVHQTWTPPNQGFHQ